MDSDLAWVNMVRAVDKADAMLTLSSALISGAIYGYHLRIGNESINNNIS